MLSGKVVEKYFGKGNEGKGGNVDVDEKGKAVRGGANTAHASGSPRVRV